VATDGATGNRHCASRAAPPVTKLETLRRRAQFLSAARAARAARPAFVLQARRRAPTENGDHIGIGYTCSRKVGNAVARNRAKRRLREIARRVLPARGRAGWDYVLIGRPEVTAMADFRQMELDLLDALDRVHGKDP